MDTVNKQHMIIDPVAFAYDFGARMYDARLGRWLSVDPLQAKYPGLSPYNFASNTPISGIDLNGLEYYYTADGRLLGKTGFSTEVRIVNDKQIETVVVAIKNINHLEKKMNYVETNKGLDPFENVTLVSLNTLAISNSTSTGMTNEELNTRAFLTLIRTAEADGNKPLDYNAQFGGGVFTENSYKEAPDDYKTHPNKVISAWGLSSSAAGAYQIMGYTWFNTIKPLNKPLSFSPMEQDRAAITLIKEQEKYNPDTKTGLFQMINNGDYSTAMKLLNSTWTSFPGSKKNPLITNEEADKIYNNALKNELNGKSIIATPQGQLKTN